MKKLTKTYQNTVKKARSFYKKTWLPLFRKYRIQIIGGTLALFLLLLVGSVFLKNGQEPEAEPEIVPLEVSITSFGEGPLTEETIGVIKNLNTITLVAQTAGPVNLVKTIEGSSVQKGELLLTQETAYNAGSAPAVQKQIASKNFQLAEESLKNTVDSVSISRSQADKSRENTEELRKISEKSIDETKSLIGLSEKQVEYLEDQIESAPNEATKNQLRGSLSAVLASLNGARSQLRNLEYQTNTDNPPTKLADLSKDMVYKSTELQLKSAEIQKDIAWLSLKSARIMEAATRVSAPFAGTIEKVYVQPGEYVTPGTPVAVLRGEPKLCLVMTVAGKTAGRIDDAQTITVKLNAETTLALPINHVSAAPVAGQLYEVLAIIPAEYEKQIYENQSVSVKLPLYQISQVGGNFFVPLDSVFVTSTRRFVFTAVDNKAVQKTVETGEIIGDTIEIISGLEAGDQVILDRRVIDQQAIAITATE